MKFKKIIAAMSLVLSISMLVGCGQGASQETSADVDNGAQSSSVENKKYEAEDMSKLPQVAKDRKDTLIIGTESPKGVFNPLFANSVYDTNIARTMYERLLECDEHGEPTPRLAESYSVSDDGLSVTYKIRKDANWSDGTPITSKDVEMTWKIMADKSYDGQQDVINGTYTIQGIKDYHDGKTESISGIELVDDKTVTFHLTNYYPFAAQDIASYEIIPSSWYGTLYKHGDCSGLKSTYTEPGPVSGAYKLTSYEQGQEVKMEANDKFYLGTPNIKNIIWKVDTQDNVLQFLKSGEIDMDWVVANNDNIDDVESAGFLGYQNYLDNGYSYISLNQTLPQFQDPAVRKALTIGLNRKKIVDTTSDKYGKVINIPESSTAWTYKEPKETYDYDVEKAKKMLDDAGWKVGSDGIREKDGVKLSCHFLCPTGNEFYSTLLSVLDHDWKELGVDIVIDSSGAFKDEEKARGHLESGAKKVVLTSPGKGDMLTVVMGVNDDKYDPTVHDIVSNASCTTNCLAPVTKVILENFGIKKGLMSTVHAYTNDQNIHDGVHKKDMRRARMGAENIIPTSTGAAKAVGKVIPEVDGILTGFALRVPVPTGSLVDVTFELEKDASVEEINAAIKKASENELKGILEYSEDELVSSDIIGNTHSSIFDSLLTTVNGKMVKLISWYDNEWGYTERVIDLTEKIAKSL